MIPESDKPKELSLQSLTSSKVFSSSKPTPLFIRIIISFFAVYLAFISQNRKPTSNQEEYEILKKLKTYLSNFGVEDLTDKITMKYGNNFKDLLDKL